MSLNPYQTPHHPESDSIPTPQSRIAIETPNAQSRRWCVYTLYALAAFWGFIQVIFPTSLSVYTLHAIALAASATAWAVFDAQLLKRNIPSVIWLIYFLTWPLASLLYLIWTRGIPGVGYWVVNSIGMLIVMALCFYPTFYLLYSLDMIDLKDFRLLE